MSSKEYVKNFVAQSLGIPSDHADLLIIDETNIRIISSLLSDWDLIQHFILMKI